MSEPEASVSILERIVARTRRLYSLPAVAARVLELTSQEQIDLRELKECIENDPALTAKILRVANSSLFGLRTEVRNLHQAIGLLGVRSLKMLVLGFSLPSELSSGVPVAVLERFWRHTLYRAIAARRFAQRLWQLPGDDAFLAGLLSGIGMLALIQDLGETYTEFLDHVYDQGGDLSEQELAVLGFDHAVLAARMLEHWGLPAALIEAVARPRTLPRVLALRSHEHPLAGVLYLADLAAEFLVTARPSKLEALLTAAAQLKNLSCDDMQQSIGEFEVEAAQLAELFQIAPPKSGSFEQMFSQAQASLAELAESSLLGNDDRQLNDVLRQATDLQAELGRAVSASICRTESAAGPQRRGDAGRASQRPPVVRPPGRVRGETGLATRTAVAIERCRAERCPLSLVLVAIHNYSEVLIDVGPALAEQLVHWLSRECYSAVDQAENMIAVGDAKFAILLTDHDRRAAASTARLLLDAGRLFIRQSVATASRPIKLSLGVATVVLPPRNFLERDLIEAARRCLQAADNSGGDAVKSIEI